MVTPKLGVASILSVHFIIWNPSVLGAGRLQSRFDSTNFLVEAIVLLSIVLHFSSNSLDYGTELWRSF